MGISNSNLRALKIFDTASLKDGTLEFFELLKFDTGDFREMGIVDKDDLVELYLKINKTSKKSQIKKSFNEFTKRLDSTFFVKNNPTELSEIDWKKIDGFCDILRRCEKSNERKIRWVLYSLYISGNQEIPLKSVESELSKFKIKNTSKLLSKIIREENKSGLDAVFDGTSLKINHFAGDKLVAHYFLDAIEEPSRRSKGELDDGILELLDEGSYSNQEISKTLSVDETMISKSMKRLKDKNKIVLSSFGSRGTRFFTTNCDNCPFGTTKSACRKEALSYIINSFNVEFGMELTASAFDEVESNQALLKMKRIVMNARKEKTTQLEKNLGVNLSKLLGMVVDEFITLKIPSSKSVNIPQVKVKITPDLANLPLLYQLGLAKGAKSGIQLVDRILKYAMSSVKKEDRLRIKKHANKEINQFLKNIEIET